MPPLFDPLLSTAGSTLVKWGKLYGAAPALAIAEASAKAAGPLIVIAENSRAAESLSEEIAFFSSTPGAVHVFPDLETLPYDSFSAHPDITSARLRTLAELPRARRGVWVVAIDTLLQRLAPRSYIEAHSLQVHVGETLNLEALRERLTLAGYAAVTQVATHGEFAVRGSLLDVFPMGSESPYRIDLLDRDVDSIRHFDPDTQRSGEKLERIHLLPARETPLSPDAVREFRRRYRLRFSGDLAEQSIYRDVSAGRAPGGLEFFLPLFFERTSHLFDYLPPSSVLVDVQEATSHAEGLWSAIAERHDQLRHDRFRPILDPAELYLAPAELRAMLDAWPTIALRSFEWPPETSGPFQNFPSSAPALVRIDPRAEQPAAELEAHLAAVGGRVLLAAESAGRRELLLELLRGRGIKPKIFESFSAFMAADAALGITVAAAASGLSIESPRLEILTESQLFGDRARQERRRRRSERDPAKILKELSDLRVGAPVVHESYGVGRYVGLQTMDVAGYTGEFLVLEYADGDKLYVPVQSLHLVSRYTGAPADTAPLHKLGGDQWQKARRKAAQRIRDVAAELLDLYSRRAAREGASMQAGEAEYRAFQAAFRFEETADQATAIDQVLSDLKSGKPMDRVICGDVGFGKTEVALRAAFVAVQAGKQAAVLVPTTLLAQQHYTTFVDRFADWPVRVESLSRFRTQKEAAAVIDGIAAGSVDIVVATHRLLQGKVRFKNLGLVVIDEEHRFGVRDKERLKALRAEVDVLTLTATPIPRTLNMAMGGLRDLSLITTPPAERLAVKTFVLEWNETIVREALTREIRRGGQIYYVHNTIETIEKTAQAIRELVPEASVAVGHGQMRERELEQLMLDFYHRRFNVLVCTTIIESGIDVPTANTIIIDRADRFGLAQIHQLRGRVGRSHHRAYAYLITPPRKAMTADAVKRLEALESLEELGAGFTLATHDLEIRGAGELLGDEQSGQIEEIGYNLYMELLERAVAGLKAGKPADLEKPLHAGPEVDLHLPALIPEDYVPDVHLRLVLYKRIAGAESREELDELKVELIDRFGPLPPYAQSLFRSAQIKLRAAQLGIRKIDAGATGGYFIFDEDNKIDTRRVLKLIQTRPKDYRLDGPLKLRFTHEARTEENLFTGIEMMVELLA
ncbi:MAG TPA: transcription-repair coupling factor [Steroidobacteraceae bacterium]|jgi:transcription-repair coupling factor (superfamily II helicase)|nr:transcription-repair coupling factor [Steroidobacteraceae bacterium]